MALHNLKITVVDGGKATTTLGSSSKSESGEKKKNDKSVLSKVLNYNQTVKSYLKQHTSSTTFFAIQQGVNLARQTGREFLNYYVSDIGRANGDSNYQAIVNRRIEKVTDGLSIGQGMLAGASAGSMIGPWGAVIGAVVGAASSSISLGFKYAERERAYQHEMFKESTSQAYQLARANYSAFTGRVR